MELSEFKILIVEDSPSSVEMIRVALGESSRHVYVSSLKKAREELRRQTPDLILLDLVLPDGEGLNFFMELKGESLGNKVPVIALSGKNSTTDKVIGLNLGVDDYIGKPFDALELQARVLNKIRLARANRVKKEVCVVGNLCLDFQTQRVRLIKDNERIDLSPLEFKLLRFFTNSKEQVLSRRQILDAVWGIDNYVLDRTVDSTIAALRKKISNWDHSIRSVYSVGYQLTCKVEKIAS